MNSPDDIIAFIKKTVAEQLPQVEPLGVRKWIAARVTEPYHVQLPVDPEGTQVEDFWIVTDHKEGKHYRIAFCPQSGASGIPTPLASGVDWYMGDYGTFKQAVEGM
jgi:hypothetical protein